MTIFNKTNDNVDEDGEKKNASQYKAPGNAQNDCYLTKLCHSWACPGSLSKRPHLKGVEQKAKKYAIFLWALHPFLNTHMSVLHENSHTTNKNKY